MSTSYSFSVPQQVIFAPGAVMRLPEILEQVSAERILIATGPRVAASPNVSAAIDALKAAGMAVELFTDIEANPSVETVGKLADAYKAMDARAIVAIGGGSPMDTAKAAAAVVAYGGDARQYEGAGKVPGLVAPFIAVPTTAGTGSEVTSFSVITDHQRNLKITLSSPHLLPRYALLDPELLTSMPASVAAATGADALVHAVEAYVSLASSSFSDAMAEKAIALIGGNLRRFTANRGDIAAACAMMEGSSLAGVAFNHARLGDVHAMSHPVSAFYGAAHGEANAVLLPTVLEFNALADAGKYRRIFTLLTGREPSDFAPMMLVQAVRELFAGVGLPSGLSELGVQPKLIPELARDAMKSGNIPVNPRTTTERDFIELYEKAM